MADSAESAEPAPREASASPQETPDTAIPPASPMFEDTVGTASATHLSAPSLQAARQLQLTRTDVVQLLASPTFEESVTGHIVRIPLATPLDDGSSFESYFVASVAGAVRGSEAYTGYGMAGQTTNWMLLLEIPTVVDSSKHGGRGAPFGVACVSNFEISAEEYEDWVERVVSTGNSFPSNAEISRLHESVRTDVSAVNQLGLVTTTGLHSSQTFSDGIPAHASRSPHRTLTPNRHDRSTAQDLSSASVHAVMDISELLTSPDPGRCTGAVSNRTTSPAATGMPTFAAPTQSRIHYLNLPKTAARVDLEKEARREVEEIRRETKHLTFQPRLPNDGIRPSNPPSMDAFLRRTEKRLAEQKRIQEERERNSLPPDCNFKPHLPKPKSNGVHINNRVSVFDRLARSAQPKMAVAPSFKATNSGLTSKQQSMLTKRASTRSERGVVVTSEVDVFARLQPRPSPRQSTPVSSTDDYAW